MTVLSVNLNKAALMRNARSGPTGRGRPDVLRLARTAVSAGAAGATLHPRPDGRHALADDARVLSALMDDGHELNLEGNPFEGASQHGTYRFPGFMEILREVRPTQATLVPDASGQRTSDHGWALDRDADLLAPLVAELRELGCRVALFLDPDPVAMRAAAALGADRVELYTGPYAWANASGDATAELDRHRAAAEAAAEAGLAINAGHDLDLDNLGPYLRAVPGVSEVSIGQAILSDALHLGLADAVASYRDVIASSAT
ncbi:MAG: pyridoxine 5'-phosphate synthase [Bacteroidota bacterium]